MKQVLAAFGVLLLVILGFYWVSNRYPAGKVVKNEVSDREIYFLVPENLTSGTETEILLKAKHENGKIVSFDINFNYDPAMIKVLNVNVNKDIFNKSEASEINEVFGKVMVAGENLKNRNKLVNGEVILATLKIKGIRKGGTMIYSSKKAEVGILEAEKVVEGDFKMPNFKVNFL